MSEISVRVELIDTSLKKKLREKEADLRQISKCQPIWQEQNCQGKNSRSEHTHTHKLYQLNSQVCITDAR